MARNGELREELKTLQLEKKHFLQIQSQLEMVGFISQQELGVDSGHVLMWDGQLRG